MLNRKVKKIHIEKYDRDGIVATDCFINVTAPGITIKETKLHSGAFFRWDWIKFLTIEFED